MGQAPVDEPPAPVVFGPNPVGDLLIVNDEGGDVRLLLNVGPATEDIMLFGQAPCSPGRLKQRRVNHSTTTNYSAALHFALSHLPSMPLPLPRRLSDFG